ncbi:MAG TPA: trypsin-like peptidase domain-containing protein [Chloroflexia bacterium]|nr:trypsin-like peptidase domain-containing protein [Chloroflexia bacterium]
MESTVEQTDILSRFSNGLADAVERVGKSIVLVNGRERQAASGIVFANGVVLTAAHVIEQDNPEIETASGQKFKATLAGRDPITDLAVLKVDGLDAEPAVLGTSAKVGQFVLSVGRPSSGQPMASGGIVSAVGGPLRTREGVLLEQYLATDARPYPGFSGGPLINADGEVLGVMTSGILGNSSVVIPSAVAARVAKALLESGTIKRGYLGIGSQAVDLAESQRAGHKQESGLLIVHVDENSPAAQAGVLIGDILVGLDGQTVTDGDALVALLSGDRIGKSLKADIIRGGEARSLDVTLGERN